MDISNIYLIFLGSKIKKGQKIFKVLTYLEEDREIFEITLNMLENFKTDPVIQPIETLN